MKTFPRIRNARGFSLLEVLVAIVILSVGLLALAVLQLNILRSSTDAKAQSVALALAKEQLEAMRAFHVWSDADADSPETQLYTDYVNIADVAAFDRTEGGVDYSVSVDVQRWSLNDAGAYEAAPSDTASDADMSAANLVAGRDFKRAAVEVTWDTAAGDSQSITLEDIIDGLVPADSARVARNTTNSSPRNVQILINDPGAEAGVIPIAINTNDPNAEVSTAATNPKPEIGGNNNSQRVYETRFDVLTYAGLNSGDFLAQARVETSVVSCTCTTAGADEDVKGNRPTYWNGIRYVAPTIATYTQPAGWAFADSNTPDESDKCNECCRDHHDPDGITGAKFDPRRVEAGEGNQAHDHFFLQDDGSLDDPANHDGEYVEVCRMIRVDGIFRVAADMYADQFNLLETLNDDSQFEFAPTDTAKQNYTDFVLDYLDTRVTLNDVSSTYNDLLSSSAVSAMETTYSLNDPAVLQLANDATDPEVDGYWLHSRGLYVDYLEPATVNKIQDAQDNCKGTDGNDADTDGEREACVLPLVPFTSINLTELSTWTPVVDDDLRVTNNNFLCSENVSDNDCNGIDPDSPTRGKAYAGDNPVDGATPEGRSQILASNDGVALSTANIDDDPYNADGNGDPLTFDTQAFEIVGGAGNNNPYYYTVVLSPSWLNSTIANPTTCPWGATPQTDEIATCALGLTPSNVSQTISWVNYNFGQSVASNVAGFSPTSLTLNCTKSDGTIVAKTLAGDTNATKYTVNKCRNFAISSYQINGGTAVSVVPSVGGTEGQSSETNSFVVTLDADDVVTINYTEEAATINKPTICTCNNTSCSNFAFSGAAACP
jgi:type IV pilus modification protein PilV